MNPGAEFYSAYLKWRGSPLIKRSLAEYMQEIWLVLEQPEKLNQSQESLCFLVSFIQIANRSQIKLMQDLANREGYEKGMEYFCVIGKMISKIKPAMSDLRRRKSELETEDFGRYLFKTLKFTFVSCIKEMVQEILGMGIESSESPASQPIKSSEDIGEVIYRIDCNKRAKWLAQNIAQNWQARELNLLCHYLEQLGKQSTKRLEAESLNNIYKLHERIKKKLLETAEINGLSKDDVELFIHSYLRKLCQKCPELSTYKRGEEKNPGGEK